MKKSHSILFLFMMVSPLLGQNINQSLISYLPFDGNANDVSGNGHNGIVFNAELTKDRFGESNSAYYFNGFNSSIVLNNSNNVDFNNGISFCAWINPEVYKMCSIVDKMKRDASGFRINVRNSANNHDYPKKVWAQVNNYEKPLGAAKASSKNDYQLNEWIFVVGTYGIDDSIKLYINCELVDVSFFKNYSVSNNVMIHVGKGTIDDTYELFQGKIDDVRIYNRVITSEEVLLLYNNKNNFDVIDTSFCQGESLEINGIKYKDAGNFKNISKTKMGCDSIIGLNINVNPIYEYYEEKKLCTRDSVFIQGNWLNEAGEYNFNYKSIKGCDSIFTIKILEEPIPQIEKKFSLCRGDSVLFDNVYYYEEGIYSHLKESNESCDSLIIINISLFKDNLDFNLKYDKCLDVLNIVISDFDEYKFLIKQDGIILFQSTNKFIKLEAGIYDITCIVNDSTSCRMESTLTIEIPEKIENGEIVLPNVIILGESQNGRLCFSDIIHNQFVFESIKIFDRIGNIVFFSLSDDICWDGKFNNQWVEQGVYTYVLKLNGIECEKNPFYKNGDITILR